MKTMFCRFLVFFLLFIIDVLASDRVIASKAPQFHFPVACTIGESCWTVHYVDTDPGEGAMDYTCAHRTYDSHKGTDFAIRNLSVMEEGIGVLAALDGTVVRVRDGETDMPKTPNELELVKEQRRECGNAVLIDHAAAGFAGLRTLYCHLKQGSIAVKPGDRVVAAQPIAQIGHSGLSEFPHLHFGVLWEGDVIDPQTGLLNTDGCGGYKRSLWSDPARSSYEPLSAYDAGFTPGVPDFEAVKRGEYGDDPDINSPALVFWAALYGLKKGDVVYLSLFNPDGTLFARRIIEQDKTRPRQFYYVGKKIAQELKAGTYKGQIKVSRPGIEERSLSRILDIK